MRSVSPFTVTGWEAAAFTAAEGAPDLARAVVRKTFAGDLAGEGVAEVFMHHVVPGELAAGGVYVALDRITGTLGGRRGAFTMQHGGLGGPGVAPFSYGYIVPGSGTGDLRGLTGTVMVAAGPEGHTITLDYAFDA